MAEGPPRASLTRPLSVDDALYRPLESPAVLRHVLMTCNDPDCPCPHFDIFAKEPSKATFTPAALRAIEEADAKADAEGRPRPS